MDIGLGHLYFALGFVVVFLISMAFAYRHDLAKLHNQYTKVWKILVGVAFAIFLLLVIKEITVS